MPLQIKDVGKESRTFTWEYLGEEIEITYNIYKFTPEFEEEVAASLDSEVGAVRLLVEHLIVIVLDWDILDGEKKVPITYDSLMGMPARLLADLMAAIGQDAGGDEEEGKSSAVRLRSRNRAARRHPSGTLSRQQSSFE